MLPLPRHTFRAEQQDPRPPAVELSRPQRLMFNISSEMKQEIEDAKIALERYWLPVSSSHFTESIFPYIPLFLAMAALFATFFFSKVIVLSFSLYIIGVYNEKMQILINSAGIKILIYFQFGWWLGDDLLQVYRLWQELHQVSEIKSW